MYSLYTLTPTTTPNTSPSSTLYIAIAIDLDASYTSVPLLSPLLLWLQPDLKANKCGILESATSGLVDWLPPGPLLFHEPHRYVVIVYQQLMKFDVAKWSEHFVKPVGLASHIQWSLDDVGPRGWGWGDGCGELCSSLREEGEYRARAR